MQMKKILPWLAVALGCVCGVLRGLDLALGYDAATGLPTGAPFETVLYAALALSLAAVVWCSRGYARRGRKEDAFETYFTPIGDLSKTVFVLCAAVFALAGLAGLFLTVTGAGAPAQDALLVESAQSPLFDLATGIPLWTLALLAAVTFVKLAGCCARGFISAEQAALTLIPVFWAMFVVIRIFKDNSGTPGLGHYVFELLAAALLTLAFYYFSGFFFAQPRPMRFAAVSAAAVVLSLTSAAGVLVALLLGTACQTEGLLRQACFAAAAAWFTAQLVQMAGAEETAPGKAE